jgi:hypothetical protein
MSKKHYERLRVAMLRGRAEEAWAELAVWEELGGYMSKTMAPLALEEGFPSIALRIMRRTPFEDIPWEWLIKSAISTCRSVALLDRLRIEHEALSPPENFLGRWKIKLRNVARKEFPIAVKKNDICRVRLYLRVSDVRLWLDVMPIKVGPEILWLVINRHFSGHYLSTAQKDAAVRALNKIEASPESCPVSRAMAVLLRPPNTGTTVAFVNGD